jgi:hypothetical protein
MNIQVFQSIPLPGYLLFHQSIIYNLVLLNSRHYLAPDKDHIVRVLGHVAVPQSREGHRVVAATCNRLAVVSLQIDTPWLRHLLYGAKAKGRTCPPCIAAASLVYCQRVPVTVDDQEQKKKTARGSRRREEKI